ncbi:hypothetical protein [Halanaerobium sp. ST460_2HS_T2]|uniref:hypothetical protein n=1 Tax=Halanaerobium sp. ST460_2HS_T2 TaxID=2183914 RepID=UPI000DF3D8E4|nr:hypothetical protein [Halanaerobium sp. ST460_2HS_T2]RCW58579.1 hypothetical protein DFR80_1101 [Halanaerobium sp. ST460_2HS_T2]
MDFVFSEGYFEDDILEEGNYRAEFTNFELEENVDTKYGVRDRLVLRFVVQDKHIVEKCLVSKSRNSKMYRFISGMTDNDIGGNFRFEDYINSEFLVEIKNNTDDQGKVWSNIVAIETINNTKEID